MKAKLRDKWVAALESGEYEQHQDSLSNGKGFCCLGVLATIAKKKIRKNSDLKVVKTKFALTIESADRSGEVSDSHSLPLGALKAVGLDEDLAERLHLSMMTP